MPCRYLYNSSVQFTVINLNQEENYITHRIKTGVFCLTGGAKYFSFLNCKINETITCNIHLGFVVMTGLNLMLK